MKSRQIEKRTACPGTNRKRNEEDIALYIKEKNASNVNTEESEIWNC